MQRSQSKEIALQILETLPIPFNTGQYCRTSKRNTFLQLQFSVSFFVGARPLKINRCYKL